MRWHQEKRVAEEGILRHPADGEAWKEFDRLYPWFAQEPRNVRMGLATDGFNPFGNMHNSYSMWPIILVPYNLPPWKCMKDPFMMMSLLIPGPKAPGRDIDVYIRPLIDELKELWNHGVETFDASTRQTFHMHAAVMWTINDFPAYGNLSGWSTKGYKACPVCNVETSSRKLNSKICYMGHRRYLPHGHSWRASREHDGDFEFDLAPKEYLGDDILRQLEKINEARPGKNENNKDRKRKRSASDLNWTKKSIFFELEYWSKLKIRHILDVMHIEKNICDSLVGTLLNIEGKTKDTVKARLDLEDLKIKKELHLKQEGNKLLKPHASYTLTLNEKREFCQFLKSVKFPDGYAANISNCVNIKDAKVSGLKSHDCHVLLQQILPIGIRPYLRKDICSAIIELCNFFRQLCAKTLYKSELDKLEEGIVLILCKLERIFPPAFFDIMVHLAVHLPHEAKYAGPVALRWMYPIERALGRYKSYVKNKARPEGSIAEAYIINESLSFCSLYLDSIETKFNRVERNDDGGQRVGGLSVFSQNVRPFGKAQIELSQQEIDIAHWYVLNNCDEVQEYLDEHKRLLQRECGANLNKRQQLLFPKWLAAHMRQLRDEGSSTINDELYALACGPDVRVFSYSGCIVNGVRFLVTSRDEHRTTQNNGVMVPGEHDNEEIDFYGALSNVIELIYPLGCRVVLFKCDWFDTNLKKKRINRDFHLTSINITRTWYKEDPFVLAIQAQQVSYTDDPKLGVGWKVVEKVQHRGLWDVQEKERLNEDENRRWSANEQVYQQNESSDFVFFVQLEHPNAQLYNRNVVAPQVISSNVYVEKARDHDANDFKLVEEEDEDETMEEYFSSSEEELNKNYDDSDIDF
ncbi:uncharacterized protein LOC107178912 isoform X1 [Citrus sinensis]|uniref:uncharacterized protein LOC107178912 isoform X1 n=1 Tax=Citrus sinensis TaxID=2711 RepID=UPI0022789ED4|nr:uncharacterized protein LOC107178912 isoform X1 [Citrus sinensis]XP_052294344.1 uncharacterized protein LOC107178912 isoform X1 [Citrus sinensis]